MEAHDESIDGAGRHDTLEASTPMSSACASANITGEINVWPPRRFAKNVRQVWDRVVGRPCRYRETVRFEMVIPSFSNSPWIRGAPQRQFSAAMRRIRSRHGESMRGLPDVATDGASIDVRLRDAIVRQCLAGSAPALPATGATTTTKTAKTDGQLRESAYPNEPGR
jgi:hypothetical protein